MFVLKEVVLWLFYVLLDSFFHLCYKQIRILFDRKAKFPIWSMSQSNFIHQKSSV